MKLLAIFFTVFVSFDVLANDDTEPIGSRMCFMIAILQYNVTRIIGMIAIMGLGVLALKGKLSWVVSLMIVVGIILLFVASSIYISIVGENSYNENCYGWKN
ncbi:TrbC/VirB2 family protein [Rickettsia endosymbiont of Pantilius tunicatus]|uniref:TrbC/VirB2 family protein n=1 Tax=Rickettsia endosymbiont of Pantilius tunicatus TaxID=3066267 RepID=UPI00376EFCF5